MNYPTYTQVKGNLAPKYDVISSSEISDVTAFTFNEAGMAHIMATLTSLYSDPHMAVLREYVSNGIDSCIEAGIDRPVEVTLPSAFDKSLTIQDYGMGMSADQMRTIYTSYGLSTKRESMDQIGAFGYGSKSALAISDQFTVSSVQDGLRTIAVISREESGVPSMIVVSSEVPTTDPNGVKIQIPVSDLYRMDSAARKYLYTVPTSQVVLLGSEIKRIDEEAIKVYPDLNAKIVRGLDAPQYSTNGVHVVIGGVSYPADEVKYSMNSSSARFLTALTRASRAIYIDIPIASVDLTPSREKILWNDRSSDFINNIVEYVSSEIISRAMEDLAKADTYKEVRDIAMEDMFISHLLDGHIPFKEARLSLRAYLRSDDHAAPESVAVTGRSTTIYGAPYIYMLDKDDYYAVILEGDDLPRFERSYRKNILDYASHHSISSANFHLFKREAWDALDEWVRESGRYLDIVKISDIMADAKQYRADQRKMNKGSSKTDRTPLSAMTYPSFRFEMYDPENPKHHFYNRKNGDMYSIVREDLTSAEMSDDMLFLMESGPSIFTEGSALFTSPYPSNAFTLMKNLDMLGTTVVTISRSRKIEALAKRLDFKPAIIDDVVMQKIVDLYDDLETETDISIHSSRQAPYPKHHALMGLAESEIELDDSEASHILDLVSTDSSYASQFHVLHWYEVGIPELYLKGLCVPKGVKDPSKFENIRPAFEIVNEFIYKYPLLNSSRNLSQDEYDHLALYINAVYNNRKDS